MNNHDSMVEVTDHSTRLGTKNGSYSDVALESLASAFCISQLILHCWSAFPIRDSQMYLMHGLAFIYDVFLLVIMAAALKDLRRRIFPKWQSVANTAAKVIFFVFGLVLACYPFLLIEFLGFPVNIFAVDFGVAGFFLSNILGWKGVLAIAVTGTLGIVFIRYSIQIPVPRQRLLFRGLVIISLLGIILSWSGGSFLSPLPNPLVYSTQETVKDWLIRGERVVPRPSRPMFSEEKLSDMVQPSPLETAERFQYDHVLLLVMETVNESDFAQRFLEQKDGFYAVVKDHAVYFSRYYTTNLDSYTSLLAMLTSVQVPYRAYEAPEYYSNVNNAPNMIDALNGKNWKSLFICTSDFQPFVPVRDVWTETIHGRDLPNKKDWVSLGVNPVEAATEDKAAILPIVDSIKSHQQTVILHEMVTGHSPRWKKLTGKGQFEYYDEYCKELYCNLQHAGLVEETIFIIVADHGKRTDSSVAENYHVPLLIAGNGIDPAIHERMFSHLDLQEIVGHYLCGLTMPKAREDVIVIGHSGRWVYGQITADSQQMFFDAFDGVVLGQKGDLMPQRVFDRFQGVINSFARYQRLQ